MDPGAIAVPHTLAHLTPLLPPSPARVIEAGCGRGALNRVGANPHTVETSILWRLVDGRGGVWIQPASRAADVLNAMRDAEDRQIAAGAFPAVGFLASIHP